jgi:hypothetical protein
MICENKSCKWRKDGKCVLFAGVRVLECKYREINLKKKPKNKTTKLKKKGN